MPPKPGAAGGSYPTGAVSSYQSMGAASGFNMSGGYDEMNATVSHDYKYMNPQSGKLPVGGSGELCYPQILYCEFVYSKYSCCFN